MSPRVLRVPPHSAPHPQFCSTLRHFLHFCRNCQLCSPSALGLRSGSSWGRLERLLSPTWSLLGASWAQLGRSWAPLELNLAFHAALQPQRGLPSRTPSATWRLLGATWPFELASKRLLDSTWRFKQAFWSASRPSKPCKNLKKCCTVVKIRGFDVFAFKQFLDCCFAALRAF